MRANTRGSKWKKTDTIIPILSPNLTLHSIESTATCSDPYSCQEIEPFKCQSRIHYAVVTGGLLPSCLRTNTIQSSLGGFCLECIKHKTCNSSALLLWKKHQFMPLHWAYLRTVFPNVYTCLGFSGGYAVWSILLLFILNSPFINTKN